MKNNVVMFGVGQDQRRVAYVSHKGIKLVRSSGHKAGTYTIVGRKTDVMHLSYHDARASVVPYR